MINNERVNVDNGKVDVEERWKKKETKGASKQKGM